MRPALLLLAPSSAATPGRVASRWPRRSSCCTPRRCSTTTSSTSPSCAAAAPRRTRVWGNRRAVLVGRLPLRARLLDDRRGRRPRHPLDLLQHDPLMAEGELLQLERSFDPTVTEAHYYEVIERKSAVLLSAACEAGAILGGVTRAERRRLAEFGRELGLAFQLRDDALDYEAGEAELGKRPCDGPARGQGDAAAAARAEALHAGRARGGRRACSRAPRGARRSRRDRPRARRRCARPRAGARPRRAATAASRTPCGAPRSTRDRARAAIAPFPDGPRQGATCSRPPSSPSRAIAEPVDLVSPRTVPGDPDP